ncbi:MAG: hypothetical protein K2L50_01700 [Bacteroidales bacterium]|nr:hypothetical protein [Bacteroidales bacterium]
MSKLFRIFTIAHKLIIHKSKEPERIKKTRVIRPRLKKQKTLIENFKTNIMKKAFCILVLILIALSGIYTASAQSGAKLTLIAPNVILDEGFTVEEGGELCILNE